MFTLHAPQSRRDLREDTVAMKVLDDGTAEITITRRHHGNAHGAFVQEYKEMTAEELKRHHQQLVSSIAQNAKPLGDLMIDYKYPGTRQFRVSEVAGVLFVPDDPGARWWQEVREVVAAPHDDPLEATGHADAIESLRRFCIVVA